MARYHFVTAMRVAADRQRLWDLIVEPQIWPSWWRWLRSVELLDSGAADHVGARHRYTFGTALPYTLSFETRVVRSRVPAVLEARASGDLDGAGLWQLDQRADDTTTVTYTWLVETTKWWMNALAPLARPAFSWNHDILMRDFATGLAGAAGAELLAVDNQTMPPSAPGFFELPAVRG